MTSIMHAPFSDLWFWLKPRGLDKLMKVAAPKGTQIYTAFINSCLTQRIKDEKGHEVEDSNLLRKDMFYHISKAKDPETDNLGYSRAELFEETNLLVLAGADTTAIIITAMFFYLTRYSNVYAKLTKEIRETFASAEDIHTGPKLSACRYLRSCIDETLRMTPPVAAELQREVLVGGIVVDGHPLEQGLKVGSSNYSLHYNEDAFPDPFTFKPERWILDERAGITPEILARSEAAFMPFSIGARACPGKGLAYLEMSIIMAKYLYWLDVRAVEGDDLGAGSADLMWGRRNKKQFQCLDGAVSCRDGPMVQFKSRAA